ncbi:MAG: cell division protein FtsB [Pseudonocardiales bacterium]|nr:MAG: cell division protein FtsB [Pseudonocardiales bacterium]
MIQREIEETRAKLARTLDELAERADPRRVASRGVSALSESNRARAIIGATAGLIVVMFALRITRRLRD